MKGSGYILATKSDYKRPHMDHVDILYICACDMVLYKCMNRKFKKDVYVCVWCVCVCVRGVIPLHEGMCSWTEITCTYFFLVWC